MIHILLATGFEEIEAVTTIDILRRCGLEVQTISVTGTRLIRGAHGIPIMADGLFRKNIMDQSECVILPGGMPGTNNLWASDGMKRNLITLHGKQTLIAAICAAPIILGRLGLLYDRRATCYPGFEEELEGSYPTPEMVVEDGHIITGRGPGAAAELAFAIAGRFVAPHVIRQLREDMILN